MRVPEHARRPTKHVAEGYLVALSRENVYLKTREAIDRPTDKETKFTVGKKTIRSVQRSDDAVGNERTRTRADADEARRRGKKIVSLSFYLSL